MQKNGTHTEQPCDWQSSILLVALQLNVKLSLKKPLYFKRQFQNSEQILLALQSIPLMVQYCDTE